MPQKQRVINQSICLRNDRPTLYYYAWGKSVMRPMDRKGQLCRVVCRGKMNSCLIQFEDGYRVVTSRNAIRKVKK